MAQQIYDPVSYDLNNKTNRWTKQYDIFEQGQKPQPEKISKILLKLQDIQDAHTRIKNDIVYTPIIESKYIGNEFCKVFLKCENLQNTGSFKARGCCNVLSTMSASDKSRGCTVSGGRNFLYAMSYYGYKQSVPINVIVPKDCPIADKQRYRENFSIVKVHGNVLNDANLHALTYSDEIKSTYIHGSDRLDLLAGYGTVGLELLTQLEKMDAVLCPVGSGGLVASIILAIKSLKPNCLIYGVECAAAPAMSKALQEKNPTLIQPNATIADSLNNVIVSNNAFHIVRGYMDRMTIMGSRRSETTCAIVGSYKELEDRQLPVINDITVEEGWISQAMINIWEREKMIVEGSAACPVAAIISGKVPELRGKNVVCILTGGNINSSRMSRVIDRGMAAAGRLIKFSVIVPDVPGALARLLSRVTDQGVDVRSFVPERAWMRRDIFAVSVNMLLETADFNHAQELEKKLSKEYPHSHFIMI